jgi:hypothetical protein
VGQISMRCTQPAQGDGAIVVVAEVGQRNEAAGSVDLRRCSFLSRCSPGSSLPEPLNPIPKETSGEGTQIMWPFALLSPVVPALRPPAPV